MRIAVIDDERPARSELKHQLMELIPEAEVLEGASGAAALEIATEHVCDIFFLDINLGDINGTALVKAIKNMQPDTKVVFVTAYSEYAVKAFELEVNDYVMKPYDQKRIRQVLDRLMASDASDDEIAVSDETPDGVQSDATVDIGKLAVNSSGKTIFVKMEDIAYIETYNRGCLIHAKDEAYMDNRSIGEFEKRLQDYGFFRSQKCYLIRLDKVKEMFLWKNNSFAVRMEGYEDEILPVGREKMKMLRQLLGV